MSVRVADLQRHHWRSHILSAHRWWTDFGASCGRCSTLGPGWRARFLDLSSRKPWTKQSGRAWHEMATAGAASMAMTINIRHDFARTVAIQVFSRDFDVDGAFVMMTRNVDGVPRRRTKSCTQMESFSRFSGRPPRGLRMLLEPLGITTPVGSFNGGVLATPDLAVISEHLLPAEIARRAVDTLDARSTQV